VQHDAEGDISFSHGVVYYSEIQQGSGLNGLVSSSQ